mmetsp:Transcript_16947/g.43970  ORF Transcript_16947/g.43970 Transcript_16947/m.43970 type:complete len:212 (-) Transcript_16947:335-970(-)
MHRDALLVDPPAVLAHVHGTGVRKPVPDGLARAAGRALRVHQRPLAVLGKPRHGAHVVHRLFVHPQQRVEPPALHKVDEGAKHEDRDGNHEEQHVQQPHAGAHHLGKDANGAFGDLHDPDDADELQYAQKLRHVPPTRQEHQLDVERQHCEDIHHGERIEPEQSPLGAAPQAGENLQSEESSPGGFCDEPGAGRAMFPGAIARLVRVVGRR